MSFPLAVFILKCNCVPVWRRSENDGLEFKNWNFNFPSARVFLRKEKYILSIFPTDENCKGTTLIPNTFRHVGQTISQILVSFRLLIWLRCEFHTLLKLLINSCRLKLCRVSYVKTWVTYLTTVYVTTIVCIRVWFPIRKGRSTTLSWDCQDKRYVEFYCFHWRFRNGSVIR